MVAPLKQNGGRSQWLKWKIKRRGENWRLGIGPCVVVGPAAVITGHMASGFSGNLRVPSRYSSFDVANALALGYRSDWRFEMQEDVFS